MGPALEIRFHTLNLAKLEPEGVVRQMLLKLYFLKRGALRVWVSGVYHFRLGGAGCGVKGR